MKEKLVRFDWAIKKLLRSKANFGILEGFLSELLKEDIKIVNIIESEGNKESDDDKFNRVDILIEDIKKDIILIELQVTKEYDFLSRLLYGTSKVITEYMKEGDPYKKVKKVYGVGIIFFDLGQGADYIYQGTTNFIGIHHKDELKLNQNQKKMYQKEAVREVYPEYFIIKVNQFDDVAKDTLDQWVYFLKNEEIKDEFNAKGLSEAREKLRVMKLPEDARYGYKRYLENLHYEASLVDSSYGLGKIDGRTEGIKEGRKEGRKEGIKEGRKEEKLEIAKNLLDILDDETISAKTGIKLEEIKELRAKHIKE